MARGSEPAVTWKRIGGKHNCHSCGRKLTIEDVGEVRTMYPGAVRVVYGVCCPVGYRSQDHRDPGDETEAS